MKWDQNNPEKVKDFIAKMKQDYAFKKAYAARRAWEFYNHPDVAGMLERCNPFRKYLRKSENMEAS